MKKKITILGSTGSIGLTTLNIISKKKNQFIVTLLAAKNNYKEICKQINKYNPIYFVIANPAIFKKVKKKFKNKKTKILDDYKKIKVKAKSDVTISAIPGTEGLLPTLSIIKSTKKLLLANKESVICGWELIKNESFKYKVDIVPIDSEHYSILQLIKDYKIDQIKKIYLTASGGPFLNYKPHQFKKIKPKDALKHPKWKMGKKITIDSSTLMNKILELIEAQKLFNIPSKKLDILIHPNSLVHAIVMFNNGLTKMLYHQTTMIIPIVNAIFDEEIDIGDFYKPKTKIKNDIENIIFRRVDAKIFPIIKLKDRVNEYPSTSIIINSTNEVLVDQFLNNNITYNDIIKGIKYVLRDRNYKEYAIKKPKTINQILDIDIWAKKKILSKLFND
jgi:1-deoxy-D-xylulose-5-phosphate reductoisomerase